MEVKIKLKIKDIEIELSEKEAGELKDILERLTEPTRPIIEKEFVPCPVYPTFPIYPDPYPQWPYDHWYVTGTGNTSNDQHITITAL